MSNPSDVPSATHASDRAGSNWLRRIRWWVLAVLLFILGGIWVAAYYLPVLVRPVVQAAAADLGIAGLDVAIERIGWRQAVVSGLSVADEADGQGEPSLSSGPVTLRYSVADILAGRVQAVSVSDLTVSGRYADGELSFGALDPLIRQLMDPPVQEAQGGGLPIDIVKFERARLVLETPDGELRLTADGRLEGHGDTTADGVAFDADTRVVIDGDLMTAKADIRAARTHDGVSIAVRDASVESAHPLLPGRLSASALRADMSMTGGTEYELRLETDMALVASEGSDLPVQQVQMPLALAGRFDMSAGVGLVRIADCIPVSLEPAVSATWSVDALTVCPHGDDPIVTVDVAGETPMLQSRLTVPSVTGVVGSIIAGELPDIDARVMHNLGGETRIALELDGGRLTLPGQQIRLTDLDGRVTYSPGTAGQRDRIDIDSVQIADLQEATRFAPVNAGAALSLDALGEDGLIAGRLEGPVTVATPAGQRLLVGTLSHQLETGAGRLSFRTGSLTFAEDRLQPQTLAPVLRGVVAAVSGDVSVTGSLAWTRRGLTASRAQAVLQNVGLQASAARFSQVDGTLDFSSLVPVRTKGTQAVSIGVVDAGVPLEGGTALVRVEGGGDVIIENAQWPFAGGQLILTSGALNTQADVQRAELAAVSVNLTELLTLIDMDGLSGEGMLGGAVPIEIRDGSVYVMSAQLAAEPGGVIRYANASTDAAGQTAQGANIAFQALENFHFEVLSVEVDGPVDGDLSVRIVLKGANPDLLEGYPVHLNITTEGAFLDLLRRGTIGFRALDVVTGKENLDGLDVERVGPAP